MRTSETQGKHVHKNSTPQSRLLEIDREFNVPVTRLFEAFKSPEAIKAWWWPNGLYTDRVEYDFREGGRYFVNMKGDAANMGGGGVTGRFEEIVENERLVMTDGFAEPADDVPLPATHAHLEPRLGRELVEDAHAGADRRARPEADAAT